MNCGYCAEFCPFDAIKMDHDYELASYDRSTAHIHDKERLSKPISYWREIAPKRAEAEEAARNFSEEQKAKKKAKRGGDGDDREERLAEAITRQLAYKGLQY
jgi:NADH-quinone oxidoreductase subunit I